MKLFNKTIDRQLFKQYSLGSDLSKQEVVAKIFNPTGSGLWFILNSDPEDPDYLWAIVDLGYGAEVGSVSRSDLETYRGRFGLGFERDLSFDPVNALELYNGLSEGKYYADGGGLESFGEIIKDDKGLFYWKSKEDGKIRLSSGNGSVYFLEFNTLPEAEAYVEKVNAQTPNFFSSTYVDGGEVKDIKGKILGTILKESKTKGFENKSDNNKVLRLLKKSGDSESYGVQIGRMIYSFDDINEAEKEFELLQQGYKNNFADGGNIENFSDNQLMIMNQNVEVEHHHEELENILEDEVQVPAWVVAKMETATQNLSDITHYLDGQKELMEDENEDVQIRSSEFVPVDEENEEEDDDQEAIKNQNVVEPINVSAGTKAELTKKFTDDAWGNLRGFLKGMEGIDLRDDYTFDYRDEQFEVEPIINSDENGVSNAVFTIFDGDGEEQGEVAYSRDGGKQKFTANSDYFQWNNAKFEDGGYFDGAIPKTSSYMSNYADGGEILLRKDLIQEFYEINGLDSYDASYMKNHSIVDGHEVVTESQAYADLGYWKALYPDLKDYVLRKSEKYSKGGEINLWKSEPKNKPEKLKTFKSLRAFNAYMTKNAKLFRDEHSKNGTGFYGFEADATQQEVERSLENLIGSDNQYADGGYFDGTIPNVSTYMSTYAKGGSLGTVNPKYKNSILSMINYKIDKRVGDSMSDISYTEALNLKNKINKDEPISSQEKKYISEMASYLSSKRLLDKVADISYTESFDFFDNIVSMAKGGEIAKAEVFGLKKNILGTTDVEMKITGMRKPQRFSVYPIGKDDLDKIITIQSETRIGKIDLSSGRGLMSQSHSNGAYFVHFQMDRLTPFTLNESDLEELKMHIFRTAGDKVGSRGIFSDNSGASGVYAKGGGVYDYVSMKRLLSEFKNEKEIFDGQIVNRGTNDFKIENNNFYIKRPNENWKIFRKIKYAEGGDTDNKYNYMLLSRLVSDCDYYLGNGNRAEKHLWAGNVDAQIEEMKRLWNNLPKNAKPEWLTMSDILDYEKKMKKQFADGGGIGFIPMDLEETLSILAKWGGTNIKGVIGILNAMIDSGVTNEDLIPKPTKYTSFQIEKATEKKIQEIWDKIKPNYKGNFEGNMYYSTLKEMISRNWIYKDVLEKFKPYRKYQKDSFADGGFMNDVYADGGSFDDFDGITYAKTKGRNSIDWDKEVREYAGSEYDNLTKQEYEEIVSFLQRDWDRSYSYADGGQVRTFDNSFGKTIIFKEEQIGKFTIGISSGFNNNRHVFIYEGEIGRYGAKGLPKDFTQSPQLSVEFANNFYSNLKRKVEYNQDLKPFQLIKDVKFLFADGGFMNDVYADGGELNNYTVTIVYPRLPLKGERSNWAYNENIDLDVLAKNETQAKKKALIKFSEMFPNEKPSITSVNSNRYKFLDKAGLQDGGFMNDVYANGGGLGKKYYVIDAKDAKILSKAFDTEEEAKVEKYKIFEKTNNFFLTLKGVEDVRMKYAKKDIATLIKDGNMSMYDTKYGVIHLNYNNGEITIKNNKYDYQKEDYETIFKGGKDAGLFFIAEAYEVEEMAKGGSVKKDWWNTVVNPNEDFNNFDNKMPIDWDVDDFKSWVVSESDLDGNVDKAVLDVVKMPQSKLLVEYLNKNGSGKNNNEFYKEFGNWQSALYDIFTQMKKDYLFKKSLKYILKADIKTVTVKTKDGKEVTYSGADVLNGNYVLAKGGDIISKATYFGKNNVVGVELKDGTTIKPANGYWVKKGAEPIGAEPTPTSSGNSEPKIGETEIRKDMRGNWRAETTIDNFNGYDWRLSTIKTYSGNLVSSAQGGKTEATGSKGIKMFIYTMYQDPNHTLEVSKPKRITDKVVTEQHDKALAKFKKFMETGMFKGGGKISNFDKLSAKVAKQYEGKPVKSQYQEEYGKYYSKEEAKEVGDKVAGKVKAMQSDEKAFGGFFGGGLKSSAKKYPNLDDTIVTTKNGKAVFVISQTSDILLVIDANKIGTGVAPQKINISEIDPTSFKSGGKIEGKRENSGTETLKKANDLAKKIRKDGESWLDAKKRAFAQLKN